MVIGRILGMAGKALAKKFLSKKLGKKGMSTFEKRKKVLRGPNPAKSISRFVKKHPKVTLGAVGSGIYLKKKKD